MNDVAPLDLSDKDRFRRAPETEACISLIREIPLKGTMEWRRFEEVTGILDHSTLLQVVYRARDYATRDFGIVTWVIARVGVRRLDDHEIASEVGKASRRKIRKIVRRTQRQLLCVEDFSKLTESEKSQWNSSMALNQVLGHVAKASCSEKILVATDEREKLEVSLKGLDRMLSKKP